MQGIEKLSKVRRAIEEEEKELESSKAEPEECVFIDDLIENVHAAQSIGIKGIHFKDEENLIIDLRRMGIRI